ncbi:mCG1032072, partial [Mus musculus]
PLQHSRTKRGPASTGGKRELTPQRCHLTSADVPWHVYVCTYAHAHIPIIKTTTT